ncbi:MAG: hypothetical protein ACREJC_22360 [Tepidisphaeraceae bacterium]
MSSESQRIVHAMRALGRDNLPVSFRIGADEFRLDREIKHDFFACTGFYDRTDGQQRVVLKMSRACDFCGIPLRWLGRWLCRREMRFYRKLSDLGSVPALLGTVGETGFVHAYAPGTPLSKDRPVTDQFFDDLNSLIKELHRRDIAYVDTNKPQNILHGLDDRPYLIDFQISYDLDELGDTWLNRWLLRRLQREDFYHLLKHKRSLRPDLMSDKEIDASDRRSWFIRLHRAIATPIRKIRRRTLKRMRESGRLLPEGSK